MTYRFLSPALREAAEAAEYYESQVPELGGDFVEELDVVVDLILRFPTAWARLSDDYRHCNLQRFPYSVIYAIEPDDQILIISIFHQRRQPLSWRRNL
jgi:plasmid stabilization system protein ParE